MMMKGIDVITYHVLCYFRNDVHGNQIDCQFFFLLNFGSNPYQITSFLRNAQFSVDFSLANARPNEMRCRNMMVCVYLAYSNRKRKI